MHLGLLSPPAQGMPVRHKGLLALTLGLEAQSSMDRPLSKRLIISIENPR